MVSLAGLRTFIAVVESGGIRSAAERMFRTPSAVSMSLKQLELEIGGALFEGERKSNPSQLGRRVLEEGRALLAHYDRACAAMSAFAKNRVGRCDVASVPSVAVTFIPEAISRLRESGSTFEIQLRDMDSRAVVEAVEAGAVELGFCVVPTLPPGISFSPLFTEPLEFVCREDHPLAERKEGVSLDEIEPERFILNGSALAMGTALPPVIPAQSSLQARNVNSILAMVRAGIGVTVLPRLCRLQSPDAVTFVPLADRGALRVVGWISRDDRRLQPATETLLDTVRQVIRNRAHELGLSSC